MNLAHLNPFRGLPNKREVWAWGMYDLANQSFTLLVTTLFLGVYFKTIVVADPARGEELWGRSFAIASLIVVCLSPLLGAAADYTGTKKRFLIWLGLGCAAITCALAGVGPGDVALTMTLYIVANVLFMSGENFLGAFLPELSTRETVGRVSALGWTMGYVGALVCLPMSLLIPGVAAQTPAGFQRVFVFAGLFFLVGAVPTMLFLKERKTPEPLPPGRSILTIGFVRLAETARRLGEYRQIARFLCVFFLYSCGVQVVVVYSGIIAAKQLTDGRALVLFMWALAAVAGVGAFLTGLVQDRLGHRRTLWIALAVWLVTAIGGAAMPPVGAPLWMVLAIGAGVGAGLGLIGTASRALVGSMTPAHKTAEFFGFWGLAYKAAGALGPYLYSEIAGSAGQQRGMLMVAACFAAGLLGLFLVDERAGAAAAARAESEHVQA